MQIKFFKIPVNNLDDYNDELNSFLNNNKIIEIEKQLVQTATEVFWCFYISYNNKYSIRNMYDKSNKIDYKSVLSESEFKIFDMLRLIRKNISKEDSASAYLIATDAELAEISKLSKITETTLKKIKGFGEGKIEKYGKRLMEGLETMKNAEPK